MARHPFAGTASDWTFTVADDGLTPQLASGATLTMWNDPDTGTQYTDFSSDPDGLDPLAAIVSSDGSDGNVPGTVVEFYGPDGVAEMWADGGVGSRLKLVCTDLADTAGDHEGRIEALENQVSNLLALSAISMIVNVEVAGVWPDRPALAGDRPVLWIGPDTPTAGGAGMADGDIYLDTAP